MRQTLSWFLFLAVLAVSMALSASTILADSYAMFVVPPWRAEVSLNFLLVLLVIAFVLAYIVVRTIYNIRHLPKSVAEFHRRRAVIRSADILQNAYRLVAEGRYGHALKVLESNFPGHSQAPMMALLGWRAAYALRDIDRIELWRNRSLMSGEDFKSACLITEAELALADRDYSHALASLQQQTATGRLQIVTLRLQLRAAQGLGHWAEVARLTRQLEKYRGMTAEQARPIRTRALLENLNDLQGDSQALKGFWEKLDTDERCFPALASSMATGLIKSGQHDEAQRVIEQALELNWDSKLIELYAECRGADATGRLSRAEKWLRLHPQDDVLLLVLGRLCVEQQLWGKAKSFLEASLSIRETRNANSELARLHEQLGELVLAARRYRAAALLP